MAISGFCNQFQFYFLLFKLFCLVISSIPNFVQACYENHVNLSHIHIWAAASDCHVFHVLSSPFAGQYGRDIILLKNSNSKWYI